MRYYCFVFILICVSCISKRGGGQPIIRIKKSQIAPNIPVNTNSINIIQDPRKLGHNANGFTSRSKIKVFYRKSQIGLTSYRFINKMKSPTHFVYTLSRKLALKAGISYNQTIYLKGFDGSIGKKIIFGNYIGGRRVETVIILSDKWQRVSISFIAREKNNNTYLYLRRRGDANIAFDEGVDVLYLGVVENLK